MVYCKRGEVAQVYSQSSQVPHQRHACRLTLSTVLVDEATGQAVNENRWFLWGYPAWVRRENACGPMLCFASGATGTLRWGV